MSEHFTRNVESVTRWCNQCGKNTRYAVSVGRLGRCAEHEAPLNTQKRLKADQGRLHAAQNPSFQFCKDQEAGMLSEAHSSGNAGEHPETSGLAETVPASRPLDEMEKSIVATVSCARFPPATASKRFIRELAAGRIAKLSPGGRAFLAFIANRFRRQYSLSAEQWAWVAEHIKEGKISA